MAEPAPAAELEDGVQAVSDWIVDAGLHATAFEALFAGFCERLTKLGVPVMRGHVAMRALHPEIRALGYSWRPGKPVDVSAMDYSQETSEEFLKSPFRHLLDQGATVMRRSLEGNEALEFPILERFRAEGATDYYVRIVRFGFNADMPTDGLITSWTTDRPGGFAEAEITLLDRLLPRVGLALKSAVAYALSQTLMGIYVGGDAGERILHGTIRLGAADVMDAVVFFADLEGFTAAADGNPGDAVVAMLNDYFDCIVPPIQERGGEVLKFMGDGLLAVFALDETEGDARTRALSAAREALALTASLNRRRDAEGGPLLALNIALHTGDVHYGNIGAHGRQDFTVIGPAVNEASRIEALCGEATGLNLLVSQTFADHPACRGALRRVGEFQLRGVGRSQTLYTVVDEE